MTRSEAACRLTIARLMSEDSLWHQDDAKVPSCYLHTLTFADPEPSVPEAMKRFNSFASNFLNKTGKRCVRVIERGEKTGRVHYHLVSRGRWDAREVWSACERYGFGRYDVRERPRERSQYAAKYVGKQSKWPLPPGTRKWAAVGFKGCTCGNVVVEKKSCVLVAEQSQGMLDWLVWRSVADNWELTLKLRPDAPPDGLVKMIELKPSQTKEILGELGRGAFLGLGEYRGCVVRTLQVSDKVNPAQKHARVVVEHNVEFAGNPLGVSEWLPPGVAESSVKSPAERGDVVLVTVESLRWDKGTRRCSGTIRSLKTLL